MQHIPASDDKGLEQLVGILAGGLTGSGLKLATAESCTGGWIAKCCTDRPGSSEWFERGFITYSNQAKMEMLGVDASALETSGAVSREVAMQMAQGALRHAAADVAVAVTGVAGPDGGTDSSPVGTVWFGWAGNGAAQTEQHRFSGDREGIRRKTVAHALQGLIDRIQL